MDNKFAKNTIIITLAVVTVIVLYDVGLVNKCPIQQIDITDGLTKYDQTKDPQLCVQINEKISQFDDQCKGVIEEVDCG
jgi:hypothetical protein